MEASLQSHHQSRLSARLQEVLDIFVHIYMKRRSNRSTANGRQTGLVFKGFEKNERQGWLELFFLDKIQFCHLKI